MDGQGWLPPTSIAFSSSAPLNEELAAVLPLPERATAFEAIIHIHGRVNESYIEMSEALVLSSSEFGRAAFTTQICSVIILTPLLWLPVWSP